MKRLQILIEEELDADLERQASRSRRSKGALVREAIRRYIKPLPPLERDPIWKMAGADAFDPVAPKDIDKVVYGR
jgi:Ribbon-helix-helix protein, copG family